MLTIKLNEPPPICFHFFPLFPSTSFPSVFKKKSEIFLGGFEPPVSPPPLKYTLGKGQLRPPRDGKAALPPPPPTLNTLMTTAMPI